MRQITFVILCIIGLMGLNPTAAARDRAPELSVTEGFWPTKSWKNMSTVPLAYKTMYILPVAKKHRWIPRADGTPISEVEFYEIAGRHNEVKRLKRRRRAGWSMLAGGVASFAATAITTQRVTQRARTDGQLTMRPWEKGALVGSALVGVSLTYTGMGKLGFRGNRRGAAKRVAAAHNAKR